ncbi:MAG: serine/threonine-protein kinase, partial [Candidatus Eremiobacterota bacterium]
MRKKMKFDGEDTPDSPLPPRYELKGELGRGGMGVVYHALDTDTHTEVAVKILSDAYVSKSVAQRLRREARELSQLNHPHLVAYLGQGTRQGREYIVLEYLPGGDLRSYLRTPRDLRRILRLFLDVARGVEYLHEVGLVHRDLKPENVLLTRDGRAKLTDLGLVRALDSNSRLTTEGAIVGTCNYLAPEQIVMGDLTPAVDLYALGACLYEACTGASMFEARTDFELLERHVR